MSQYWEIASENWFSLFKYSLYYIIGGIIVISNSLIVVAIAKHRLLRMKKEYIMVGGLALADVLNGMAYTISGLYRSYLILEQTDKDLVTPWECMETVHNWFFAIGQPASAFFLVCVNIDRLIAVTYPMKYYQLPRSYALILNGIFGAISIAFALGMVYISYNAPDVAKYPRICFSSHAYDGHYYFSLLFNQGRTVSGLISVMLFVVVCWEAKKMMAKSVGTVASSQANKEKAKRQRQMTVTIGISSLFTFLLFVIPNAALTLVIWFDILLPMLSTLSMLNAVVNFLLYTLRHKDLWYGIKFLFTCQKLTEAALVSMYQKDVTSKSHKATVSIKPSIQVQ